MSDLVERDAARVWHPYAAPSLAPPPVAVESARGVRLRLSDGQDLIDGMSSWWSTIFGYGHPDVVDAVKQQLDCLPHVMFGGLTHEPAVALCEKLCVLVPGEPERVFLCDSGSVSVEVAIKLALQTWQARGRPERHRLLSLRGGYHGDTFGAMSVCDPVNGMHRLFQQTLASQLFAPRPRPRFGAPCTDEDLAELADCMAAHGHELAAVILEPVVQGAGGMWFYSPEYLARVRRLCDQHDVLLIADEIATGFGRTGRLFACEYADVAPDLLCVGKALTAGTMTLAATVVSGSVCEALRGGEPGIFMHGPTFMGNPLACAAANASLALLEQIGWKGRVDAIEAQLERELRPCEEAAAVADVRVLGAIGVVELHEPVDMALAQSVFLEHGVWIRPFGRLVYIMPPYVIEPQDLSQLTSAIAALVQRLE